MRAEPRGMFAVFEDDRAAAAAVDALRERGVENIRAQSPAPYPRLERALGRPVSRIGWFAFVGGVLGAAAGFWLTIWTSLDMPLMVGGKPIVSLPPYVIIAFEMCILFGGLGTFFAVVIGSLLSRRFAPVPHDPRCTVDRIGIFVPGEVSGEVAELMRSLGAEEVRT